MFFVLVKYLLLLAIICNMYIHITTNLDVCIVHMTRSSINHTKSGHYFLIQMNQGSHMPRIFKMTTSSQCNRILAQMTAFNPENI